jgi:PhoPQ-activated pathogenicity-related protein
MAGDGSIHVKAEGKPTEVNLWQATNPKARDFRLVTIEAGYKKSRLEPNGDGVYVAKVPKPETGWTAYFAELVFENGEMPFKFTTQVGILPDVLPHKIEGAKKPEK